MNSLNYQGHEKQGNCSRLKDTKEIRQLSTVWAPRLDYTQKQKRNIVVTVVKIWMRSVDCSVVLHQCRFLDWDIMFCYVGECSSFGEMYTEAYRYDWVTCSICFENFYDF